MDANPQVNVVVFEVQIDGERKEMVSSAPTQQTDCVRVAWEAIRKEHDVKEEDVRQIYSEWQPSAEDCEFMDTTFPPLTEVTYSFERPATPDGWAEAFEKVGKIIRDSLQDQSQKDTAD